MRKHSLSRAAKLLGTGSKRLKADLIQRGILDAQGFPVHQHVTAGRMVTELRKHNRRTDWNNGNGQLYWVTLITDKGILWLADQLGVTVRDMDALPLPADSTTALNQAHDALRLMRMHINCPTAVDSATALAVAEEALQLLEQHRQRSAA